MTLENKIKWFLHLEENQSIPKFVNFMALKLPELPYVKISNEDLINGVNKLIKEANQVFQDDSASTIYDMLHNLVKNTSYNERTTNFHSNLDRNYKKLLRDLDGIDKILLEPAYHKQIKRMLPYVRFEILHEFYLCQDHGILFKDLLTEFCDCIKYQFFMREDCYKVISQVIDVPYKLLDMELNLLTGLQALLGEHYQLKLLVNYCDKIENFNFFLKSVPVSHEILLQKEVLPSMKKEILFYNVLLQKYKTMELDDILDFIPKVYFIREDEYIIMEDLGEKGYSELPLSSLEDDNILENCIKTFAKLHAASIITEEKLTKQNDAVYRFDTDASFKELLKEYLVRNDVALVALGIKTAQDFCVHHFPQVCNEMTRKEFHRRTKIFFSKLCDNLTKSNVHRNVICHGDSKVNNIMFKRKEQNENHIIFVDYQLVKYTPPALEILFFLYLCIKSELRVKHEKFLLTSYYEELNRICNKYGINLEEIFDEKSFFESVEDMRALAVGMALIYSLFIFHPSGLDEVKKEYVFDEKTLDDITFKSRIEALTEELYSIFAKPHFEKIYL